MSKQNADSTALPANGILATFASFFRLECASGILLLVCVGVALIWANSPWGDSYEALWAADITIGAGRLALTKSLHHWINDGLMVIFFLLVGLEIKREALGGELAGWRKASLPILAAVGGMILPAGIYAVLNYGGESARGWGIPMATDIAFALGVLALIGKGVPLALRVFLTAIAIVDDIGAVLVIAVFYSGDLAWQNIGLAGAVLLLLAILNRARLRSLVVYAILGVLLWLAVLKSGIHATIAGVLLAMCIPARSSVSQVAGEEQPPPLQRLEHLLHPWVSFLIMPLFALANAGIHLDRQFLTALDQPVALGVIGGLLLGKPLGITLLSLAAVRLRVSELPAGIGWRHVVGAGCLGGIGFTMSLFVANLAFDEGAINTMAKGGILIASAGSAVVGWLVLSPRLTRG